MIETIRKLVLTVALCMAASGCGGGGAGGGWSSGDLAPTQTGTGNVTGYVYQIVQAANRTAAGRIVITPLQGATISAGGVTGVSDSSGYYIINNVPVGSYSVQIKATGYQTITVPNIVVSNGATTTATQQGDSTYALTPTNSSGITVNSNPSGAEIYIDGADTSSSTSNTFTMYAGNHNIKLTLTGYEDYEITEDVSSDKTVTYQLTKLVTSISATPANLTITAGATYTPSLTCTYIDSSSGACPEFSWTSSNSSVALVGESTGLVTASAIGNVSVRGVRSGSNISITIPVTVISAGDTLTQVIIDADGVSSNALILSSGGTAEFTGSCGYTSAGTAACPPSCVYSSSDISVGTVDATGGSFSCDAAGGLTEVKLTCGSTISNIVEVSCAVSDSNLALKVLGAADADDNGVADAEYSNSLSVNPGDKIIIRLMVENGTSLTGFRTDLEIDSDYITPVFSVDSVNCSGYNNLAYDTSSVCVENFGTVLSPSNPFFGTSNLDSVSAVTYVSGATVEAQTCVDASKQANRIDCAISTRQVSDVQPTASGSGYFAYFIIDTDSAAASGSQTSVNISLDTMQIMGEDGISIEIGASQVSGLTVNFQ